MATRDINAYCDRLEIDPALVGERLGFGAQHAVFVHGEDEKEVVKFPRAQVWWDPLSQTFGRFLQHTPDRIERDQEVMLDYFGNLVEPQVMHARGCAYALFQRRLPISDLTPQEAQNNPALQACLTQIVETNRKLLLERGEWFDLMGWNAGRLMKPHLDNTPKRNIAGEPPLVIADTALYPAPNLSIRGVHAWFLRQVQRWNLRKYGQELEAPATTPSRKQD
jgi:hypothetical protein